MLIKFHYFKQEPTKYINQKFKFYFPFGSWRCGIGLLIARREFSITWPPIITSKEIKTATDKEYLIANPIEDHRYYGDDRVLADGIRPTCVYVDEIHNDIVIRLRNHIRGDYVKTSEFMLGLAADEIERLRNIIFNYYFEERNYQDAMSDRVDPDFTVRESWKKAFSDFEVEAYRIESGYYD